MPSICPSPLLPPFLPPSQGPTLPFALPPSPFLDPTWLVKLWKLWLPSKWARMRLRATSLKRTQAIKDKGEECVEAGALHLHREEVGALSLHSMPTRMHPADAGCRLPHVWQ